ncbi:MAG: endonuclease [Xanthomonadales bacterium]|nr:endonuclease [Xanthomonadales bacterium]
MKKLWLAGLLAPACVLAQVPDGYYDAVDDRSSANLRTSLHLTIDDHTRIPYTSFEMDTWDVLELADQDQDEPGRITTLYRNASYRKRGGGNDFYNREHSWPRSYGFPDNSDFNYPFTDMHALFLADADYNSARENRPYENCPANCTELATEVNDGRGGGMGSYPGQSNWTRPEFTEGAWEVWIERRGDVARAMFYMDVRYEGGVHGSSGAPEPDLILTDSRALIDSARTGSNQPVAYMGLLSTLLEWHEADPVDDIERQHHEAVFEAQGNRNPFIDNPAWVECVFQGRCGNEVPNPAGLSGLWFDPDLGGEGYNVIVADGGTVVFFYGYSVSGERLWLVSETLPVPWRFRETVSFEVFEATGGTFDEPAAPDQALTTWGTLAITFEDCTSGRFELAGTDGTKQSRVTRLAAIQAVDCNADQSR